MPTASPNFPRHSVFAASRWWVWRLIVVALLSGYVLSVGPACWLADRGILPKSRTELLNVPYFPLVYASHGSETTANVLASYIDFWTGTPEGPARDAAR